jgi:hypothetical protein
MESSMFSHSPFLIFLSGLCYRLQASAPRRVLTTEEIEERGTNRSRQASKQPNRDLQA